MSLMSDNFLWKYMDAYWRKSRRNFWMNSCRNLRRSNNAKNAGVPQHDFYEEIPGHIRVGNSNRIPKSIPKQIWWASWNPPKHYRFSKRITVFLEKPLKKKYENNFEINCTGTPADISEGIFGEISDIFSGEALSKIIPCGLLKGNQLYRIPGDTSGEIHDKIS